MIIYEKFDSKERVRGTLGGWAVLIAKVEGEGNSLAHRQEVLAKR